MTKECLAARNHVKDVELFPLEGTRKHNVVGFSYKLFNKEVTMLIQPRGKGEVDIEIRDGSLGTILEKGSSGMRRKGKWSKLLAYFIPKYTREIEEGRNECWGEDGNNEESQMVELSFREWRSYEVDESSEKESIEWAIILAPQVGLLKC